MATMWATSTPYDALPAPDHPRAGVSGAISTPNQVISSRITGTFEPLTAYSDNKNAPFFPKKHRKKVRFCISRPYRSDGMPAPTQRHVQPRTRADHGLARVRAHPNTVMHTRVQR